MGRNHNKIIIILLILLISIGFAFLSSNLSIIGNTLVSKQIWDIHFESPTKVGGNVDATSLELTNSTTVDFSADLLKPKDSYEFSVDVVNNGSIDAMISSITATELTASQKKLFEYVITYDYGAALKEKQLLAHNSSDKYKVTVRYKDDISSTDLTLDNQTINVSITVNYVQADGTAINRVKNSFISLYNQTTPGVLSQVDEVNIGDGHFYIFSEDNDKYVLLSKYNLNVGSFMNPNIREGIQDKSIISYNRQGQIQFGMVAFSNVAYWMNGDVFNTYYGTANYNDIYDNVNYISSSGNNYSVAYYVNNYKSYLNTLGADIIKERLLTLKEFTDMGCIISSNINNECASDKPFLYATSYWLGTVRSADYAVYRVNSDSWFGAYAYEVSNAIGVRPVIEISKQYL